MSTIPHIETVHDYRGCPIAVCQHVVTGEWDVEFYYPNGAAYAYGCSVGYRSAENALAGGKRAIDNYLEKERIHNA